MCSNQTYRSYYFWHSLRILFRYQQIYVYPIGTIIIALMPKFFGINETYYLYSYSLNMVVALWIYSPFYLGQFSFSPEDAKSLTLFSIKSKELVRIRNFLNFALLFFTLLLLLIVIAIAYTPKERTFYGLVLLYGMIILPAIFVGNLMPRSTINWTGRFLISWKSVFVILIAFFNDFVIKISLMVLSQTILIIVLITLFLIYLLLYILSYNKIVKEITIYFGSIAER